MKSEDGLDHLRWATRFQAGLLLLGLPLWGFLRSWASAFVFLVGGLTSLAYWGLHWRLTSRMLTPSVRLRWLYGFLSIGKLALIVLVLRGMMGWYPGEALPLATGVLLFVAGILLESVRLLFKGIASSPE